jgi:IS5 family transposase
MMRVVQNPQMQIGEVDISQIQFDSKSRDDIPRILRGLQYLYMNLALREEIFQLLEKKISPKADKCNGRPGMDLWKILVCGVVRLDLNEDYDRLHELVNHHDTLRLMLGHGEFDKTPYPFQTLKDNVTLLTPEVMDEINQLVVKAGHGLIKKKAGEALRGRCDSFVVETDVHYPTLSTLANYVPQLQQCANFQLIRT